MGSSYQIASEVAQTTGGDTTKVLILTGYFILFFIISVTLKVMREITPHQQKLYKKRAIIIILSCIVGIVSLFMISREKGQDAVSVEVPTPTENIREEK